MRPVLVIHGGAGSRDIDREAHALYRVSLETVLKDAYRILDRGGSALAAVTRAAELLENDPLYNAGRGSKIQRDGHIRLSASLMDGYRRRFAGCVNVEDLKNPIRLAELLLKEEDRVLEGRGARAFARAKGLEFASPFTPRARAAFQARLKGKTGTIGAVALDRKGRLAAATSAGGRGFEYPHRVSDSPTVAGNFANRSCAISATGVGEQIVEFALASSLCALAEAGHALPESTRGLLRRARKEKASFGLIGVTAKGEIVASTTTKFLIWGAATRDGFEIFKVKA